jgi:hypothetical protein
MLLARAFEVISSCVSWVQEALVLALPTSLRPRSLAATARATGYLPHENGGGR